MASNFTKAFHHQIQSKKITLHHRNPTTNTKTWENLSETANMSPKTSSLSSHHRKLRQRFLPEPISSPENSGTSSISSTLKGKANWPKITAQLRKSMKRLSICSGVSWAKSDTKMRNMIWRNSLNSVWKFLRISFWASFGKFSVKALTWN